MPGARNRIVQVASYLPEGVGYIGYIKIAGSGPPAGYYNRGERPTGRARTCTVQVSSPCLRIQAVARSSASSRSSSRPKP